MKAWIGLEVANYKISPIGLFQVRSAESVEKTAFSSFSPVTD
jgi:hypothetical protein